MNKTYTGPNRRRQRLSESTLANVKAHLKDYIHLMNTIWPNEDDAVKSRARQFLKEIESC
jgi:hypothetical protein